MTVREPALDFARLCRDFGPAFPDAALRTYGRDSRAFRRGSLSWLFPRC